MAEPGSQDALRIEEFVKAERVKRLRAVEDLVVRQERESVRERSYTKTLISVLSTLEKVADHTAELSADPWSAIATIANRLGSGVAWDEHAVRREAAAGGPEVAEAARLIARLRLRHLPRKDPGLEPNANCVDTRGIEQPATNANRLIAALLTRIGTIYNAAGESSNAPAPPTSIPWRRPNDAMPFPTECDRLGQRLADVESAIDHVRQASEDVDKASRFTKEAKRLALLDACRHTQSAIVASQDAIPGVAPRIDPLVNWGGSTWTSRLKQLLANMAGMIRREGGSAAILESREWREAVEEVADKRCFLANADYSTIVVCHDTPHDIQSTPSAVLDGRPALEAKAQLERVTSAALNRYPTLLESLIYLGRRNDIRPTTDAERAGGNERRKQVAGEPSAFALHWVRNRCSWPPGCRNGAELWDYVGQTSRGEIVNAEVRDTVVPQLRVLDTPDNRRAFWLELLSRFPFVANDLARELSGPDDVRGDGVTTPHGQEPPESNEVDRQSGATFGKLRKIIEQVRDLPKARRVEEHTEGFGLIDAATLAGRLLLEAQSLGALDGDPELKQLFAAALNGELEYQRARQARGNDGSACPPRPWHAWVAAVRLLWERKGCPYQGGGFGKRELLEGCPAVADYLEAVAAKDSNQGDNAELPTDSSLSNSLSQLDDAACLTHVDLAAKCGINPEALRKRLDRWRKAHDDGWNEVTDRRPGQPRYLYYRVGHVRPVLKAAIAAVRASG